MTLDIDRLLTDSPLREWMADPVGRRLLERELADINRTAGLLEMRNFPLSHLANFGVNLDHDAPDRIASAWRHHASVS